MTAKEFKDATKELGWTLAQAAERLNVSPNAAKNYGQGRTKVPPSVVDDINKHLAFSGKTPAARREPLSASTGPSRAIAALEVELKNRNAIISRQGERIEDLLRTVTANDDAYQNDADYVEQIIQLEELCEKFQEWSENAQARLTTATHANPSPFKDWTGKEWPPLQSPPVYIPKGEDIVDPNDQRPEGEWSPA